MTRETVPTKTVTLAIMIIIIIIRTLLKKRTKLLHLHMMNRKIHQCQIPMTLKSQHRPFRLLYQSLTTVNSPFYNNVIRTVANALFSIYVFVSLTHKRFFSFFFFTTFLVEDIVNNHFSKLDQEIVDTQVFHWEISNWSDLPQRVESPVFEVGGYQW